VPVGALLGSVTVAFAVVGPPARLTEDGLNEQVAFAGPPVQVSGNVAFEPLTGVMTVNVAFFVVVTCDAGDAARLKSTTCTVTGADVLEFTWLLPANVAVIVRFPAVAKASVQVPAMTLAPQLSPVLA
jgi:hypothetical protein